LLLAAHNVSAAILTSDSYVSLAQIAVQSKEHAMKHTGKDVEKLAAALNRFGDRLNKDVLWREQKAAYKSLASLTSYDFVAELNEEKDNWRRNVKLRYKLSEHWKNLVKQDKLNDALAVTRWKIINWGGIKNVSDATIREHFADAVYRKYYLPFEHISSKSKALALVEPEKLQIYDARVAVSLNVIQLVADTEVRLYFAIPSTQIRSIQHNEDCFQARLPQAAFEELDFVPVPFEDIYSIYTQLLLKIARDMQLSPVEVEMSLFGLAFEFSEVPETLSEILGQERKRRRSGDTTVKQK
jgi:hypothetical protein